LKTDLDDPKALRDLSDQKIQKIGSGIALLGGLAGDKVSLILRVSKDLTARHNAGDLVKQISAAIGGTGGGRPDMAQGGGSSAQWSDGVRKLIQLLSSRPRGPGG